MLGSLDPHSTFLNNQELNELAQTKGEFEAWNRSYFRKWIR